MHTQNIQIDTHNCMGDQTMMMKIDKISTISSTLTADINVIHVNDEHELN